MKEIGVDISPHRSKKVEEFLGQPFDWIITVCDLARQSCPVFPGAVAQLHWSIEDPAAAQGTAEQRRAVFRRVRDELAERIRDFTQASA